MKRKKEERNKRFTFFSLFTSLRIIKKNNILRASICPFVSNSKTTERFLTRFSPMDGVIREEGVSDLLMHVFYKFDKIRRYRESHADYEVN